jgi:hypothetical protein
MVNTRHQKSGLFKVQLDFDEVDELSPSQIKDIAQSTREYIPAEPDNVEDLVQEYDVPEKEYVVDDKDRDKYEILNEFSDLVRNPDRRKCIQILEQGEFGPGDRNSAVVRLAAYYKGEGRDQAEAYELINQALDRRAEKFPDANAIDDRETEATLNHVYSPKWTGGTFSCRTDDFLAGFCSENGKPCAVNNKLNVLGKSVQDIGGLFKSYVLYGAEAEDEWPEFGLTNLDDMVRIRPRNYSIIAGANGSGKTSLILEMMAKLNAQKIPHLFFSLDMADSSLFEKLAAKYTQYSLQDVEKAFASGSRPGIMREIGEVLKEELPYTYFDFTSSANMSYIRDTVKKLNDDLPEDAPVKVIFVDYAGRLSGEGDSQYANATSNALLANDVAKETNTHIMFIAQISRQHGDHTDPIRNNRVAKESGAWEENATSVLTVWRPFGKGIGEVPDDTMVVYVGKNRTGVLGECYFTWNGRKGTIRPMDDEDLYEYEKRCKELGMEPPTKLCKKNQDKKSERMGRKARDARENQQDIDEAG